MDARLELEHSVGLEVVVEVIDILIESETWPSRTGGVGGLSGSDIVLSGHTEGEHWYEQCQQYIATTDIAVYMNKTKDEIIFCSSNTNANLWLHIGAENTMPYMSNKTLQSLTE